MDGPRGRSICHPQVISNDKEVLHQLHDQPVGSVRQKRRSFGDTKRKNAAWKVTRSSDLPAHNELLSSE